MNKPAKGFTRHKGHLDIKSGLIEAAIARAGDAALRRFIHQLYAHVSGRDLEGRTGDELRAAAAELWAHGALRAPGRARIAVVNPPKTRRTVVHIVNDDMPFLVDSVGAELARHGFAVHLLIHPILRVRRESGGRLIELAAPAAADAAAESWMRIEIDQCLEPARLAALERGLEAVLGDVRAAVEDWEPMRARAGAILSELFDRPPGLPASEIDEAREFLKWLTDGNFTFLGYREYALTGAGARIEEREDGLDLRAEVVHVPLVREERLPEEPVQLVLRAAVPGRDHRQQVDAERGLRPQLGLDRFWR